MKKIFLVVIAIFMSTSLMAEVNKSAIKGYAGLGFNSQPLAFKTSDTTRSGRGVGLMFNSGVILNDKARINFYGTTANVAQTVDNSLGVSSVASKFWKVTSIGISYDYLLGDKKNQGWFVGGGIVKTTIKADYTSSVVSGNSTTVNTQTGSASSTSLLLRGGYVHSYSDTLFLLVHGNYDTGKPKLDLVTAATITAGSISATSSSTDEFKMSTGLNFGVSLNYIF